MADGDRPRQTTSLLDRPLFAVEPAPGARKQLEARLEQATADFVKAPDSADAIIWMGRRTAYLGRPRQALDIYTRGLEKFPDDARLLRHRGHRYVTLRQFDKAIADLTRASQLIAGKPEEPEPSGADPSQPSTETLHYAIWYHLGLAYYLKGDFGNAEKAYRQCLSVAHGNDDQIAGASDWLYMTLRRLRRDGDAAKVLQGIHADMKVKDDRQYLDSSADVQG
jgi:tetratricopeptide (TPR) repeat protein